MQREKQKNVTDEVLIQDVKDYLAKHKNVTRGQLRRGVNTSIQRLERLALEGHITMPRALTRSQGATLGRAKSNCMAGWYINKPTQQHGR